MANWTQLQTLTNFDALSVCTDGTDIYFVQYGGGSNYQVFKYTVATDTISQISNDASWGVTAVLAAMAGGGLTTSCLQWFKSGLYAAVYASGEANKVRVYKYNGSGTAWTLVRQTTKPRMLPKFGLACTTNHIILIPSTSIDDYMGWAEYSSDGSSWGAATVENVPAAKIGNWYVWTDNAFRQSGSRIVIHDRGDDTVDYNERWFEWNGAGTFAITNYTENNGGGGWVPPDAWLRSGVFSDVYFWYLDGAIWKYSDILGSPWLTPTNHNAGGTEIFPVVSIGFDQQVGDSNAKFHLMAAGVWDAGEAIAGDSGLTHAVKLDSGYAYAFDSSHIYGRDEPFSPPTTGNALYIYKTSDSGDSWSVRKVAT